MVLRLTVRNIFPRRTVALEVLTCGEGSLLLEACTMQEGPVVTHDSPSDGSSRDQIVGHRSWVTNVLSSMLLLKICQPI